MLKRWRNKGESIKKGEFVTKTFFLIIVIEVLKTYLLMCIKAKVKQQETKGLIVSYI